MLFEDAAQIREPIAYSPLSSLANLRGHWPLANWKMALAIEKPSTRNEQNDIVATELVELSLKLVLN